MLPNGFQGYQVLFQWSANHETMFATGVFLVCQILGIVESQIGTENIFSLARILTNLK
jgi:hypothetical protein